MCRAWCVVRFFQSRTICSKPQKASRFQLQPRRRRGGHWFWALFRLFEETNRVVRTLHTPAPRQASGLIRTHRCLAKKPPRSDARNRASFDSKGMASLGTRSGGATTRPRRYSSSSSLGSDVGLVLCPSSAKPCTTNDITGATSAKARVAGRCGAGGDMGVAHFAFHYASNLSVVASRKSINIINDIRRAEILHDRRPSSDALDANV
ncbi:hypothetical protein B0T19DRAFT_400380 [Cercophora scortea]|uniref:Uncharacterized protein n=1 Tax=Cercophora scortea TaxID=314031 RepID=A0AAE0ILX5_9PEZI|nr:hypothetical protein B0T19DRAFT_400380 [Cercophora scortea]